MIFRATTKGIGIFTMENRNRFFKTYQLKNAESVSGGYGGGMISLPLRCLEPAGLARELFLAEHGKAKFPVVCVCVCVFLDNRPFG